MFGETKCHVCEKTLRSHLLNENRHDYHHVKISPSFGFKDRERNSEKQICDGGVLDIGGAFDYARFQTLCNTRNMKIVMC